MGDVIKPEKRGRKRFLPRNETGHYFCEICKEQDIQKAFESYFARYIHIERHHKDPKIKCLYPGCEDLFRSHFQRDRHFIVEHAKHVIGRKKRKNKHQ